MQEKYEELSKKTGKNFDEAYVEFTVKDHKEDIEKFEEQAEDGKNADLKAFAAKMLPSLRAHLQKVESIENMID